MHLFLERNLRIINGIAKNKNIAGSYIFYGQTGSFICPAAEYFAKAINCLNFNNEVCDCCKNCLSIKSNSFSDILKIESDKKILVGQIRKIQDLVKFGPSVGEYMIVIIPNSQDLTNEAANSFLKTLEEPPKNVCFILLTNNISALLPTIRSRSQQLDFPSVKEKDLQEYLNNNYEEKEREEILEKCFHSSELLKYYLETNQFLELPYLAYKDIAALDPVERLKIADNLSKNKQQSIIILSHWLKEICDEVAKSKMIMPEKNLQNLNRIIENISQIKYNLNLKLHLENLLINI